jgi:hypothetical protein
MCYTTQDIERMDKIMDAVVKKAYRLPQAPPQPSSEKT